MSNEIDRPRPHINNTNVLPDYDQQNGFLVIHLGVSLTTRFEPDGEKALAAVADKSDMFLVPCVRVRRAR